MHEDANQLEFVHSIVNVRYAETDQMGIVYYANYLVWFEIGRGNWCRARGFNYREMEEKHDRLMVVAEASCRYKAPARYEDRIRVSTALASASSKVIRFRYEIRNHSTGQFLASGESTHVVTDREFRPARLPEQFRKLMTG